MLDTDERLVNYIYGQGINLVLLEPLQSTGCHVITIADLTDSQTSYELIRASN